MRREPIPDAVLRACACWREGPATDLITGEVLTDPEILQHLLSMVRADAGDLARELLALRGAARCVFECMSGSWAEVDPKTLDVLREALPPMQPKEPA